MLPYRSLLDRLRTQHESIDLLLRTTSVERLLQPPEPGKWSIKDNIAHLARYQVIFIDRLNRIAAGDKPVFESYVAENDNEFPVWRKWALSTLLERLYEDRRFIIQLIDGLSCTQIEATGSHQKLGALTTIEWTEFFLLHEAHHLYTIFRLQHNINV